MDKSTYEVRLAQWAKIVKEAMERPDDVTLKKWLLNNGISKDKYYYWQRRVRKDAYDKLQLPAVNGSTEVAFAEVKIPSRTPQAVGQSITAREVVASIKFRDLTIDVTNDIRPEFLAVLIREASHA